jgi:biotin transport system substrate-specific component
MNSKITVRGVVFSALFAALMAVMSMVNIHLGFTPVPITLGNMAVMLAGALLGAGYGFFSMLLVVILTVIGLPMLHGSGGLQVLLGPTGGYVMMYPICALLTGWCSSRIKGNGVVQFILMFLAVAVFGDLLCYVSGMGWLMHVTGMSLSKAWIGGAYPFIPGDLVKAFVTTLIVFPIRSIYPISRLVGNGGAKVAKLDDAVSAR